MMTRPEIRLPRFQATKLLFGIPTDFVYYIS
jgi:hypothetical protein